MGCCDFISYILCMKRYQKIVLLNEQRESFIDELESVYKEYDKLVEILIDD